MFHHMFTKGEVSEGDSGNQSAEHVMSCRGTTTPRKMSLGGVGAIEEVINHVLPVSCFENLTRSSKMAMNPPKCTIRACQETFDNAELLQQHYSKLWSKYLHLQLNFQQRSTTRISFHVQIQDVPQFARLPPAFKVTRESIQRQ